MSRRHSRPPGPRAVPAPRGGKRGAEGAGEAIMDGMRVGDVAGADFDAIERMLAAPADDAVVRLSRLRERERACSKQQQHAGKRRNHSAKRHHASHANKHLNIPLCLTA